MPKNKVGVAPQEDTLVKTERNERNFVEVWKMADGRFKTLEFNPKAGIYFERTTKSQLNIKWEPTDGTKEFFMYFANTSGAPINTAQNIKPQIDALLKNKKIKMKEFVWKNGNVTGLGKDVRMPREMTLDFFENKVYNNNIKSNHSIYKIKAHGFSSPASQLMAQTSDADRIPYNASSTVAAYSNTIFKNACKDTILIDTWKVLHNILDDYIGKNIAQTPKKNERTNNRYELDINIQSCWQRLNNEGVDKEIAKECQERDQCAQLHNSSDAEQNYTESIQMCNNSIASLERLKQYNIDQKKSFLATCAKYPHLKVNIRYCPNATARIGHTLYNMPMSIDAESYLEMAIRNVKNSKTKKFEQKVEYNTIYMRDIVEKYGRNANENGLAKVVTLFTNVKKAFTR